MKNLLAELTEKKDMGELSDDHAEEELTRRMKDLIAKNQKLKSKLIKDLFDESKN